MSVRVYCNKCKGGDNHVWKGSLHEWGLELSQETPPEWFNYIQRHESAHPGHKFMVEYPTRVVPFRIGEAEDR